MIISKDTEKAFKRTQTFTPDKRSHQTRTKRELPQPQKGHLQKNLRLISNLTVKEWDQSNNICSHYF